jgi:probable H4MPT-linked C1 transfer pathway protein
MKALHQMTILGLDIGGANIKAADETGRAASRPFAIWRNPERLKDEIAAILVQFPEVESVAVTMTAELADCFTTKAEGVQFILESINTVVGSFLSHRALSATMPATVNHAPVMVWTTEGQFFEVEKAREMTEKVAAANWHALTTWCGKFAPAGASLLVDIGTTTTDMIPLMDGKPIPLGLTDLGRLQNGELSYSGVRRTPLCAVAHSVPFRGGYCSLAAELFATTLDIHLMTGEIPEDAQDLDTANGKPATKANAWDRIARMLCCDRDEVSFEEAVQIARFLADVQRQRLAGSLERVVHRSRLPCETIIVSGSGTFLARRLVWENRKTQDAQLVVLADQCSQAVAESACAYAVAQLASERLKSH